MKHFKLVFLQILFITLTVLSVASCNSKQKSNDVSDLSDGQGDDKVGTPKDTDPIDQRFLDKAAEINLEEIQLGKLAQQRSTMADVKHLGKMMQEDHSKLMESLTILAEKKGIKLPTILDEAAQTDYQTLDKISGIEFDKKYCDMMAKGHKGAIAIFEKDSTETQDAAIRQWVIDAIPVLRKHHSHSIICQEKYDKSK